MSEITTCSGVAYCLYEARLHERGPVKERDLSRAKEWYERARDTALTPRDRRYALQGLARVCMKMGQYDLMDVCETELARMKAESAGHPKDRQLYVPVEQLLKYPYLRKHEYCGSSPGKFNPKKRYFGDQKLICATVWHKRPYNTGINGCFWVAEVYWLKHHDPPFSYEGYSSERKPCEAVSPQSVLRALGIDLPE